MKAKKAMCVLFVGVMLIMSAAPAKAAGTYTYKERKVLLTEDISCSTYRCSATGKVQYYDYVYQVYKDVYLDGVLVRTENLGKVGETKEHGCYC